MPSAGHRWDTRDLVYLGALGLAAYVLYQFVSGVKAVGHGLASAAGAVGTAYTSTTHALGSGLYALFGPSDASLLSADTPYLAVHFPDGMVHPVPKADILPEGLFTWTGWPAGSQPDLTLQLVKDARGSYYATLDA